MVSIIEGWSETYEHPSLRSEQERELQFGQNDHVRYYGADFCTRVEKAGFAVGEYVADGH